MSKEFGHYIKNLRHKKHLTLKQVSNSIGISFSYLGQIEAGDYNTRNEKLLRKLADFYEVTFEEFSDPDNLNHIINDFNLVFKTLSECNNIR